MDALNPTARRAFPGWTFALFTLAAAFTIAISGSAEAADLLASQSGAYVQATGTDGWTIGNRQIQLSLDVGSGDLEILQFGRSDAGALWPASSADAIVTIDGRSSQLGRSGGFVLQGARASATPLCVALDLTFVMSASPLQVTRHYIVCPESPTVETWTSFQALSGAKSFTISRMNVWQMRMPAGRVHWTNGLRGDSADSVHDEAFSLQTQDVAAGATLTLGSRGRSSEQVVPWFLVEGDQSPLALFGGLLWSGSWQLSVNHDAATMLARLGLPDEVATQVREGRPIDTPHAVFGLASDMSQATRALRSFIDQGIRAGRPLKPMVIYNTWFAYGTSVTEEAMRGEMAAAAGLGAEVFVLDAGWYTGAGAGGVMDFDAGLGGWEADPARFPNGLKPLTDYAHSLGMLFGLWVEPERTNLSQVGLSGVDPSWLATHQGDFGSDHAAQICFASAAARQWIFDQLTTLIDAVQPDYLKWDNNMWIECDRSGHGHDAADGAFQHLNGLYAMFAELRSRYPEMLMENVSGGGNRLDLGMLRYSDVAWMDDRSAPSVHVRHNIQGLSAVFPPAYLFSFVTDHVGESVLNGSDLSLYFRSRMTGVLGLCFRSEDLSTSDTEAIRREIAIYKSLRETLSEASATLLSDQAAPVAGPAWDVLEEITADSTSVVITAVQSDPGSSRLTVRPTGLQADAQYEVRSVDQGLLGTATGASLMSDGVEILTSPESAAHMLTLGVQDGSPSAPPTAAPNRKRGRE
jgi:alpha-galactosidase